jgi:hypothetical protein
MPDREAAPSAWPFDPFAAWEAWARAVDLRAPLSGDVSQAIRAAFADHVGQLGLINIGTAASGDPELERRIVDQVASYGRQLGWVLDAVDALIRARDPAAYGADDQEAFERVATLRADVEGLKARAAAERVERLVDDVRTLRRDPEANADVLDRLRAALAGD